MRAILTGILLAVPSLCAGMDSFLFPRNFLRGYVDVEVNPPGGERDLGRCSGDTSLANNYSSPCAAFTRYMFGGNVEFQPLGRKAGPLPLNRLYVFLKPKAFHGQNPAGSPATASMEAILLERSIGVGIILPGNFDLRIWQHRNYWLGRYGGNLGVRDLGPNGPYGLYTGVALRWYSGWGPRPANQRFLRGYAEFEVDPPHNERDLGRCLASAGAYGGAEAPCSAFTRYALGGYAEFQPFERKAGSLPLQRLLFIAEPRFFFGRNVPQFRYSASMKPVLLEASIGLAVSLPKSFEFRVMEHRNVWLGRHGSNLGPADLGQRGPYGHFASFGLRWYFGGWGRSPS